MEGLSRLDELCQEAGRQATRKPKDKVPAKESGANGDAPSLDDFLKMFEEEDSQHRLPVAADLIVPRSDEEAKNAADATIPAALLEDEDGDVAHVFLEEPAKPWEQALSEVPRCKLKSHEVVTESKRGGFSATVGLERSVEHKQAAAPAAPPASAPVRADAKAAGAATAEGIFANFGSNRAEALRAQKQEAIDRRKAEADFFARFASEGDDLSDNKEEEEDLQQRLARLRARHVEEDQEEDVTSLPKSLDEPVAGQTPATGSVEDRKREEARLRAQMMKERAQRIAAKRKDRQHPEQQTEREEDTVEAQRQREEEEQRKAEEEHLELERQKLEQEKLEEARKRAEEERLEAQRQKEEEQRKAEEERLELERQKLEQEKLEEARKRAEEERLEAQRRQEEEEQRKAEQERLELERQKLEQEKLEEARKRAEEERLEAQRRQEEEEQRKAEEERLELERQKLEQEKLEEARKRAEEERPEAQKQQEEEEQRKAEQERLEVERQKLEQEKLEEARMRAEKPPEEEEKQQPCLEAVPRRRRGGFSSTVPGASRFEAIKKHFQAPEDLLPTPARQAACLPSEKSEEEIPSMEALLAMLGEDDARAPEAKEQEEPVLRPVAESTGIPKAAEPESAPSVQEKPAARRRRGGFSSSFGAAPVAVQPQGENLEAQTRSTITTAAVSESVQDGATTDEVPSMEALLAMLDEDREG